MLKIIYIPNGSRPYRTEIRNIRLFQDITHIHVHDSFIADDKGYIVTTCFQNPVSWESVPVKHEQLAMKNIIRQLSRMHKLGYTHGDIAQKNILVNKSGTVAFIDMEDAKKTKRLADFVKETISVVEMFSLGDFEKDCASATDTALVDTCELFRKNRPKYDRYRAYLVDAIHSDYKR